MSDKAIQTDSKLKAKIAECEGHKNHIAEIEKEISEIKSRPQTVIVQPTDQQSEIAAIIDKMMDHDINKTLNQQELAETALKTQRLINDEKLRFMREEQELISKSPSVIAATKDLDNKIAQRKSILAIGGFIVICAMFICFWAIINNLAALFIAGGLFFPGIFLIIIAYAPSVSPEDAKKIDTLSKIFSLNFKELRKEDNPHNKLPAPNPINTKSSK